MYECIKLQGVTNQPPYSKKRLGGNKFESVTYVNHVFHFNPLSFNSTLPQIMNMQLDSNLNLKELNCAKKIFWDAKGLNGKFWKTSLLSSKMFSTTMKTPQDLILVNMH